VALTSLRLSVSSVLKKGSYTAASQEEPQDEGREDAPSGISLKNRNNQPPTRDRPPDPTKKKDTQVRPARDEKKRKKEGRSLRRNREKSTLLRAKKRPVVNSLASFKEGYAQEKGKRDDPLHRGKNPRIKSGSLTPEISFQRSQQWLSKRSPHGGESRL